jgi:hypothetical protein
VIFEVNLGRLVGMVVGVKMVGVREVGVERRLFVRARFVVPRGFLVMTGSVFEVFGSLRVMLRRFLGHGSSGSSVDWGNVSGRLLRSCLCGTEARSRLAL